MWIDLNSRMMNGITTIGTHAPLVNLVTATTIRMMNVVTAPTPLSQALNFQRGSRSFWWWRTMPACDSVNDVNTPTA